MKLDVKELINKFLWLWGDWQTLNTDDTWVPVIINGRLQHRVIPKQYNESLQNLLVVEQKNFSGTWRGSTATTINGSIAKTGYTPLGIVGASTNHGSVVLIRFYSIGTTGYVEGRNTSSSQFNASPWVRVLYIKN